MTVTVNVNRQEGLYGEPVVEKWTLTLDPAEGDLEARVRCCPLGASKAIFVRDNVPAADVPDEILERAEDELREFVTGLDAGRWR
jgi:hypothetical protein